jgi:hypothetical protein
VVAYELLFEEDENLDQGPFAECVRDQHLKSRTAFVEEVRRALMAELDGVVGPVTLRQTVGAFRAVDADLKPKLVNEYLCRGFDVSLKVRLGLCRCLAGAATCVLRGAGRPGAGIAGLSYEERSHHAQRTQGPEAQPV